MRIEQLTEENVESLSLVDIHRMRLRLHQLFDKYGRMEKSEGYVAIDWPALEIQMLLLAKECKRRKLEIDFDTDSFLEAYHLEKDSAGIYLVPPHGRWIWEGKKLLIVKAKRFTEMVGKPLVLVSASMAYGVIKLKEPSEINLDEFFELAESEAGGHLISETERQKWWPGKKTLYAYEFQTVTRYDKPRPVIVPRGTQTFIQDVNFKKASRSYRWGLTKPSYRIFELEDLKNTPGFKTGKAVVESKFDGVRAMLNRGDNGEIRITTDPEETATPNKTKRLPWQTKELAKLPGGGFSFDAELVMIKDGEVLHRTTVNALINGKFDPTEASKSLHVYIFDVLELSNKSLKDHPLKERKEELARFKDSLHIHFVTPSTTLNKPSLSYVVDLGRAIVVKKASDTIMGFAHKGGPFPKRIAEGLMFKKLEAPYSGKTWAKWKEKYEVDALVVGKHEIIREGKKSGSYNYDLAVGKLSRHWAAAILRSNKKAIGYWDGKKLITDPAELKRLLG